VKRATAWAKQAPTIDELRRLTALMDADEVLWDPEGQAETSYVRAMLLILISVIDGTCSVALAENAIKGKSS
jgi:hypothetical protein